MYAVVETGGKQYKVSQGERLRVEKLPGAVGETIVLDRVLLLKDEKTELSTGHPYLEGAVITAKVIEQAKDKKVTIFRYKPKKRVRIKRGHRQPFTLIEIESISLKGKALPRKVAAKPVVAPKAVEVEAAKPKAEKAAPKKQIAPKKEVTKTKEAAKAKEAPPAKGKKAPAKKATAKTAAKKPAAPKAKTAKKIGSVKASAETKKTPGTKKKS